MDLLGYLHSKGNNCTGKSLGLFAYRTSKGVMLVKSTDALIHFGYTRYFHYYRIRRILRNHLFILWKYFEFVGKRIGAPRMSLFIIFVKIINNQY